MSSNYDKDVVSGFGDEWSRLDQTGLTERDFEEIFDGYFGLFPWDRLPEDSVGLDIGCGSGRWAKLVAPRVGSLHCVDASSEALAVAKMNLSGQTNCIFHHASVDKIPLADETVDFGYSLGVLHHIPDTQSGLDDCVRKLKKGAPFLLYLYYAFDNKKPWFRLLWKISELGRFLISRLPSAARYHVTQAIAAFVYWPLARMALFFERQGVNTDSFPLSYYRSRSFYVMRTDALDRFGTRLEKRFTRKQIIEMMQIAGLTDIAVSDTMPYWCAIGYKA